MTVKTYWFVAWLSLCFCHSALAEIYKWQDDQGKWHFSDAPKHQQGKATVVRTEASSSRLTTQNTKNLKESLYDKYRPVAVAEEVTLSVVGVETHLGQGSGFFVSDTGYIVTNKHVIRPAVTGKWQQNKKTLDEGLDKLAAFQKKLDEERVSLAAYSEKLAIYKSDLDRKSKGSAKSAALTEYQSYEARYLDRLSAYQMQQQAHDERSKEFKARYADFNLKGSMAGAARQFTVVLKDNSEVQAQLIQLSRDHDLALLRLKGYQTPFLPLAKSVAVKQGVEVFAVGSPLGLRDAVTSGIITSLRKNYLVTDAQILPGNSGGPLLHQETGEVLGVNTLKFGESALSDGFGFAIPIAVVINEFSEYF